MPVDEVLVGEYSLEVVACEVLEVVDFAEIAVFELFGSTVNPTTAATAMIRITTTLIPIRDCVFIVGTNIGMTTKGTPRNHRSHSNWNDVPNLERAGQTHEPWPGLPQGQRILVYRENTLSAVAFCIGGIPDTLIMMPIPFLGVGSVVDYVEGRCFIEYDHGTASRHPSKSSEDLFVILLHFRTECGERFDSSEFDEGCLERG